MNDIISIPSPLKRNIFLTDHIDQNSIQTIISEIISINEHDRFLEKLLLISDSIYTPRPIMIYIDSYGGDVHAGLGLIDVMKSSLTPVHTVVNGVAASMAVAISVAGKKRYCYTNTSYMIHQSGYSTRYNKVQVHEEKVINSQQLQSSIDKILTSNTKITQKKLDKIYSKKIDWWMSAEEALKLGIVDEVL